MREQVRVGEAQQVEPGARGQEGEARLGEVEPVLPQ